MRQFIEDEQEFRRIETDPMYNSLAGKKEGSQVQGSQLSLKGQEEQA
jgi:hypothetical protein